MEPNRRDDGHAAVNAFDAAWVEHRGALMCLAYDVIGEWSGAEDIAARAWERGSREVGGGASIENPVGWLRRVTARLAIDEARSARMRRETYVGTWLPEPVLTAALPEDIVISRSLLGLGLLRVLQELEPVERAVFVLREGFAVPYTEIGECVGRTAQACRQIVSRAKRRLPQVEPMPADEERAVLSALVAGVVTGDVEAVVQLVSEGCVLWSDGGGVVRVAPKPILGGDKVIRFLQGVQRKNPMTGTRFVEVNGSVGLLVQAADGDRLVVLERGPDDQVVGLQMHANPDKIAHVLGVAC